MPHSDDSSRMEPLVSEPSGASGTSPPPTAAPEPPRRSRLFECDYEMPSRKPACRLDPRESMRRSVRPRIFAAQDVAPPTGEVVRPGRGAIPASALLTRSLRQPQFRLSCSYSKRIALPLLASEQAIFPLLSDRRRCARSQEAAAGRCKYPNRSRCGSYRWAGPPRLYPHRASRCHRHHRPAHRNVASCPCRTHRSAQSLKCVAQLRTLGQALVMHQNEHGGYFPLAGYIQLTSGLPPNPAALGDGSMKRYDYVGFGGTAIPQTLPGALALTWACRRHRIRSPTRRHPSRYRH